MFGQRKQKSKENDLVYKYSLASSWEYMPEMVKDVEDQTSEEVDEESNICSSTKKEMDEHKLCIIEDILLYPPRLKTLWACDTNLIPPTKYRQRSFGMVFSIKGRNMSMIAVPLICLLLWDVIWIAILVSQKSTPMGRNFSSKLDKLVSPLLTPVSFLLVFRLGRAAVRFWDARSAVGKVVELCRTLMSTVAASCTDDDYHYELMQEFAKWLCVFPIAVKNFVRPSHRNGWRDSHRQNKRRFEIGLLLDEANANNVLNVKQDEGEFGPIIVLNKLRKITYQISATEGNSPLKAAFYRQVNEQLDTLTGAWGAIERINATPLPFVYVVHLRTFLLLYLAFWHLESLSGKYSMGEDVNNAWIMGASLPLLFFESWSLLGIEAAAVECERPFGWRSNHMPLGRMCVIVTQNVAQTLKNFSKTPKYKNARVSLLASGTVHC